MSHTACVLPHLALAVQNLGDVCVCNVNKQSLAVDGQTYFVDQSPIDRAWSSETRREIAQALDTGHRHPSCQTCWDAEDAGKISIRQAMNDRFGQMDAHPDQPRIMIVKPGNTCNAACRMCNPATSSSWYQDDFQREKQRRPDLDFRLYIRDFESVRHSFHPNNENFWPVMDQWYSSLEFMDIYGGEPWLIPALWHSLQRAVDSGHSGHIDLAINTNASVLDLGKIDLLSNFRSVHIKFSFDSHDADQFEYIRHKLRYAVCRDNTLSMLDHVQKYPQITCSLICSPTILNIGNLDHIQRELSAVFPVPVSVDNFVTGPDEYYDVRHLPRAVKQDLLSRFQHNAAMRTVVNFLGHDIPGCSLWWPKFCMETDRLDRIRDQSFARAMPQWHAVLEPYWDYSQRHPEWF